MGSNLNCSANHVGDTSGEFFNDTSCGTWIDRRRHALRAALSSSYADGVHAGEPDRGHGDRNNADPYKIVTVVDAGTHRCPPHPDRHVHHRARVVPYRRGRGEHLGLVAGGAPLPRRRLLPAELRQRVRRARHRHRRGRVHHRARSRRPHRAVVPDHVGQPRRTRLLLHRVHEDQRRCRRSTTRASARRSRTTAPASAGTRRSRTAARKTFSSLITFSPLGILPLSMSITANPTSVANGNNRLHDHGPQPEHRRGHAVVALRRDPRDVRLRRGIVDRADHRATRRSAAGTR